MAVAANDGSYDDARVCKYFNVCHVWIIALGWRGEVKTSDGSDEFAFYILRGRGGLGG